MALEQKKLRILSFNVGLLRFRAFGVTAFTLFSNPPYAKERFPHICKSLAEFEDVDIICLQECYEDAHFEQLVVALKPKYPYHARVSSGFSVLKFNNGLVTFSKHPIADTELVRLQKVSSLERHLANKSNLNCDINIPDIGNFTIVHIHTTGKKYTSFAWIVVVVVVMVMMFRHYTL